MSYVALIVLYLAAAAALLYSGMATVLGKSAIHEILAGVYALIAVVAVVGIGVIHALHRPKS